MNILTPLRLNMGVPPEVFDENDDSKHFISFKLLLMVEELNLAFGSSIS